MKSSGGMIDRAIQDAFIMEGVISKSRWVSVESVPLSEPAAVATGGASGPALPLI